MLMPKAGSMDATRCSRTSAVPLRGPIVTSWIRLLLWLASAVRPGSPQDPPELGVVWALATIVRSRQQLLLQARPQSVQTWFCVSGFNAAGRAGNIGQCAAHPPVHEPRRDAVRVLMHHPPAQLQHLSQRTCNSSHVASHPVNAEEKEPRPRVRCSISRARDYILSIDPCKPDLK